MSKNEGKKKYETHHTMKIDCSLNVRQNREIIETRKKVKKIECNLSSIYYAPHNGKWKRKLQTFLKIFFLFFFVFPFRETLFPIKRQLFCASGKSNTSLLTLSKSVTCMYGSMSSLCMYFCSIEMEFFLMPKPLRPSIRQMNAEKKNFLAPNFGRCQIRAKKKAKLHLLPCTYKWVSECHTENNNNINAFNLIDSVLLFRG